MAEQQAVGSSRAGLASGAVGAGEGAEPRSSRVSRCLAPPRHTALYLRRRSPFASLHLGSAPAQLGASWGCFWGLVLRLWLPHWNIMPGLYAIMAGELKHLTLLLSHE
jgi:hypothetical protein